MSYNVLRDAISIRNSFLCVHDNLDGYATDFHENGNVDGWDVYNGVYLYGCWSGVLFGTAYDRSCYISRSNVFQYVEAEKYYYLKIMMKITSNNPGKVIRGLTKGRIQWVRLSDSTWSSDKQFDFDIVADDKWRLYLINLGPAQWWQGNINNLRVYPFIDGWDGDQFAIKYIKIGSLDNYACSNTQCSYYTQYIHPCPGAGVRGSCEAASETSFTTISGVNDELLINIDGYGEESFRLGNNTNVNGVEMARIIGNSVSSLNIGGYAYCDCAYTNSKLKITSGTAGSRSGVSVGYSPAAELLGFYDSSHINISTMVSGTEPASGFDYASSRLLTASEINKLVDGLQDSYAYVHNPDQYNIEGGRRDFNEVGNGYLMSTTENTDYYESLNNSGRTVIDMSHPINNNGRIKSVYIYGKVNGLSKIKICRPINNGTLEVIYSMDLPVESSSKLYTVVPVSYRIDCNVLVNKGDLIGIYNADLYVGKSATGLPDATFCQVQGDVSGVFNPGDPYSFGVGGFSIYARGDRQQSNFILDIDLGDRINIEEVNIYGAEDSSYFEYNIAACLDVNWQVDLYNEDHIHTGTNWLNGISFTDVHTNIYYGRDCLDDCARTPDNGEFTLTSPNNGIATTGPHPYFYVNGDAEWLYHFSCDGKSEYCWARVPDGTLAFTTDPISFSLIFPYNRKSKIFKSIMYFKDRTNFRQMSLSYYLGPYLRNGNAETNDFQYIPNYTSIKLDGISFAPDDKSTVNDYIFTNPMDDTLIYDANRKVVNWRTFAASSFASWNVIEHNFDDIECYGFRIFTKKHSSTKITELELYGRFYTEPSLVDNVSLSFSDYGDIWNMSTFNEIGTEKLTSFIGGAPRYFSMEFESLSKFTLNEIEFLVSDEVKFGSCADDVYIDESKSMVTNPATAIDITNVYDKSFDLVVDLPQEKSNSTDIVFWSKLGSITEIDKPEIGPSCILHKSAEKNLLNDNNQCAINVPAYGLKNLIDGKQAYVNQNNTTWDNYGTLCSGVSIDLCTGQYEETVIEIPTTSESYFKLALESIAGASTSIRDIVPMHDDTVLEISKLYVDSAPGFDSQTTEVLSNGIDITPRILIRKDMGMKDSPGQSSDTTPFTMTECALMTDSLCNGSGGCITGSEFMIGIDLRSPKTINQLFIDFSAGGAQAYMDSNPQVRYSNDNINWTLVTGLSKSVSLAGPCGNRGILTFNAVTARYFRSWCYYRPYLNEIAALYNGVVINGRVVGFKLKEGSDTVNKIRIIHTPGSIGGVSIYVSNNNQNNYTSLISTITQYASDYNVSLAIDLERRYDLAIIRNYGNSTNKLLISTSSNVVYSNTSTSNIEDVVWGNSTYNDARWMRIDLLTGDGTTRCIRKLGVYPDITTNICRGGGYNCEWESLGNILSDYEASVNVAYGASVTGTNNHFMSWTPEHAVDGVSTNHVPEACWGFQTVSGVNPYLEIEFDKDYLINEIVLYHGYDPDDDVYMNTSFDATYSSTTSGTFSTLFSVSGNSSSTTTHQFTPVTARRIRITVTGYTHGDTMYFYDEDNGVYFTFDGSFLREVEIYTYTDTGYIDSESWPVVCMNLNDKFTVVGHELINKNTTDITTNWDNDEQFFKYSDSMFDDPQKVPFVSQGQYVVQYSKTDSSGDVQGSYEYIFSTSAYFESGYYEIGWESFHANSENEISLRLEGQSTIDSYATSLSTTWTSQTDSIFVPVSGYYAVKAVQHISSFDNWGARNPLIRRPYGYSKWVAVTRDTAENYSYDNDATKYGEDYLSNIKVFGDTNYNPTEYSWWWTSLISTLSVDYLHVVEGSRSLKVDYPTSSGTDVITFIEGDHWGNDVRFSSKDLFSFQWYVSDISKLDTDFGYILFGNRYCEGPAYYIWNITNVSLVSGWNEVKLKFEDADIFYPATPNYEAVRNLLSPELDFRNNDKNFTSMSIGYRGKGHAFTMNLDSLKIQRNAFEEDAKFGKGLCLTGYDYMEVPLSNVNLEKGTIEFWMRSYTDSYGRDIFENLSSRIFFTIVNNNNDIVSLGIKSGNWLEPVVGHIRHSLNIFDIDANNISVSNYFDIDDVIHIALVWSNDGRFMDNGDTVRLYMNGALICSGKTKWQVGDTKSALIKLGGATSQSAYNSDAYGSAIFDNLKIYNYCKTSFNTATEGVGTDISYTPNDFLEISADNVNFYGVGSSNLPLVFSQVPSGDFRTVYLRTYKDVRFKQSKTTGSLLIEWTTTV